jgi:hypothetical protein
MKTSLWARRVFKTGHRNQRGIPAKLKTTFMVVSAITLMGCAISDSIMGIVGSAPTATSVPATLPAATTIPDSPTIAPSFTPQPTFTELPTYTPFPTYTLLPTYPLLPTYTSLPSLTPEIYYFPPSPYPTYPYYTTGQCCTLRVWNRGNVTYWIGTKMPYGGNYIKPLWYVEFYMHEPTPMWIEFCRVRGYTHHMYNCERRYIYLDESLEQTSIP